MRRNIIIFIAVLIASYLTAPYFGAWYDKFSYQYGSFFFARSDAVFFAGLLFSYVTFIPLMFEIFGKGNKKKIISWSLLPVILFYLYDSISLAYIPILASIIAFLLAKLINFSISKLKHPNIPAI